MNQHMQPGWKACSIRGRLVRELLNAVLLMAVLQGNTSAGEAHRVDLERDFAKTVRPFVENYCLSCHDTETAKADFDISPYTSIDAIVRDYQHWDMVLEKLETAEMPPKKAKKQPAAEVRDEVIRWTKALRKHEAQKNAGDPGPVLARRLSNAEYDYTIRDLTGVDIRPTRTFPVDPANQAGFDNSGESLAMSPALFKKYMQAARHVAEHLALKPEGFEFAPHPVVADTDRDKWAVLRIVDFYKDQPIDYADYFLAAWRFVNREQLGTPNVTLGGLARDARISEGYLNRIWSALTRSEEAGPLAAVQTMWNELPKPGQSGNEPSGLREGCAEIRNYVVALREKIIPEVKNLRAPPIHEGAQALVLWKNRQMAANRRKYDTNALTIEGAAEPEPAAKTNAIARTEGYERRGGRTNRPPRRAQAPTPDIVQKGGISLPPELLTTKSSATFKMAAAKKSGSDPDLIVPADLAERERYLAAFARFADVFPDAFYITERARVYMDAEKEQENSGRLLSAGFHSMTGFFRDDAPLYDLVLDDAGRRQIDRLWREFDFLSSVPQRMHTSLVWFERTDSGYLRDAEFDPYRPEDQSIMAQEKIRKLGDLYLAKAKKNEAGETVQAAIEEHFARTAEDISRVEQDWKASESRHLNQMEAFAERAYRRPLLPTEREDLRAFYRLSREENGISHEEAMRDCVVRTLMSPHFCFRIDLVEASAGGAASSAPQVASTRFVPLSDHALANRLSYFLWSSMPDEELLRHAVKGELHRPEVLKAQVRRMLQDARIRNFAAEFAGNWLDFRRFEEHNSVDRARYPAFNDELRTAMFEEPIRFFVELVRQGRPVLDFLYADYTFVNAPLARHYGFDEVPSSAQDWMRVEGASRFGRGGLLPMSVFLTANSPGLRTSPVKRGYWVVRRVLGERIPPPPAVVPELPSDEKDLGERTLRQALASHRENEACAGCHARFDSFGLVFEHYGPAGERRSLDFGGRAVDTKAEFPDGTEGDGLAGLRSYIRAHRESDFLENLSRKLLAYALGRTLIISDDSTVEAMRANLPSNGHRFSSLVETIVLSPQFLNKRSPQHVAAN